MSLDVKEAARLAKQYIADIYSDEPISGIGLEEVKRNPDSHWLITVGFFREFKDAKDQGVTKQTFLMRQKRQYKQVEIDDSTLSTGPRVVAVHNFETPF
jgi:hypothetical protein